MGRSETDLPRGGTPTYLPSSAAGPALQQGRPLPHEFERSTGQFRVMDPGPRRIVVVDPQAHAYGHLRRLVHALPRRWQCMRCESIDQAQSATFEDEPDIFIVTLEDDDPRAGIELIRNCRAAGSQAVLLALAQHENPDLDVEAMEAGADGFLVFSRLDAMTLDRSIRYADRLRAAVGCLERQRSRYTQMLEALEYGVWEVDLHALDLFACDRAAGMLGVANAATLRLEGLAKLMDVNARRAVLNAAHACISGERRTFSVEIRYIRDEGFAHERRVWLRLEGKLVRDEQNRPHRLVGSVYDVTEQKRSEQAMKRFALRDALTDLPNRRALEERLAVAITASSEHDVRCGAAFGLLYVDLDGFKPINDQYGHEAGDEVLKIVAERLSKCVRREDTVARVGGDEFVLMLEGPVPARALERTRDEIRRALQRPMPVLGHTLTIDASVGIAAEGLDGEDAAELIASADKAMYREKRKRKTRAAANCGVSVFGR